MAVIVKTACSPVPRRRCSLLGNLSEDKDTGRKERVCKGKIVLLPFVRGHERVKRAGKHQEKRVAENGTRRRKQGESRKRKDGRKERARVMKAFFL